MLSKLGNIKSAGLREYVDQWIFSELLPKLPHQLKHVEILRVYVLLPLIPIFSSGIYTINYFTLFLYMIIHT